MDGERCDGCRFWKDERIPYNKETASEGLMLLNAYTRGLCRRYPAQAVVWVDPDPNESAFDARQPFTLEGDWCGEFQSLPIAK